MTGEVAVTVDAGVMTIAIDRPEQRNAVTLAVAEGIAAALSELDGTPEIAAAVLTGTGGTFCSGMDLKLFLAGERAHVPGRGAPCGSPAGCPAPSP
jgi:enoyl-CoA hydratase